LAVSVPVNVIKAFCDCVGPADGVAVKPAGTVNVTFEFVRLIVVNPPSIPSSATKSGLSAADPQVPDKSPVLGIISARLTVTGSTIT
jgi:hypothetical protein